MFSAILSLYLIHKLYGIDGKHVKIMKANNNQIRCEVDEITASSDPNEHHPLVNVEVDRLLYMLRTIHHRRFVEIGMKSVQEH